MAEDIVRMLDLAEPIQWGGTTVSRLEFVRPRAKHFRGLTLEAARMGDLLDVVAALCHQPPSLIGELSAADTFAAVRIVNDFLLSGQPTG